MLCLSMSHTESTEGNEGTEGWVVGIFLLCIILIVMRKRLMMSADDVKYIVIHCSATRCNQNYTVEQMRKDHKERGFYDIGYHFYIRKDGTRTQHRMLLEVGAHAKPYNRCSIGICYEGGLDEEGNSCNTLTRAQREEILDLLGILRRLFPRAKVVGHRDLPGTTPKDCPCLNVDEVLLNTKD